MRLLTAENLEKLLDFRWIRQFDTNYVATRVVDAIFIFFTLNLASRYIYEVKTVIAATFVAKDDVVKFAGDRINVTLAFRRGIPNTQFVVVSTICLPILLHLLSSLTAWDVVRNRCFTEEAVVSQPPYFAALIDLRSALTVQKLLSNHLFRIDTAFCSEFGN